MKSPKIEKIAIVILILFAIKIIANNSLPNLLSQFLSPKDFADFAAGNHPLSILSILINLSVNFCLAIWVFIQAKAYQQNAWAWAILTIPLGVNSIILFYLSRILHTSANK
jgi:hypothetical protein